MSKESVQAAIDNADRVLAGEKIKVGGFMEIEKSHRYRINVSTSVKGIKTYDCTCDFTGYTMEETLEASDLLVKELDGRYPAPKEEK